MIEADAYIGLGSNLEHPRQQIQAALDALEALPDCHSLRCAPWYQSKAIGPEGQPDYINTVAHIKTTLAPLTLLHQLQTIENTQGRQRHIRWGARTLDLDLLLYDNILLNTDTLQLPHPEMQKRNFVLLPLHDLEPELILPDGKDVKSLVQQVGHHDLQVITHHDETLST